LRSAVSQSSNTSSNNALARAFQRDVVPLIPAVCRLALRITRNPADAEDLVQDTMLKAYAGFRSLQQGTNLRAWLYQILIDCFISAANDAAQASAMAPPAR
jgi:RNA polymerase sigma-70 factor, ECF subfamily